MSRPEIMSIAWRLTVLSLAVMLFAEPARAQEDDSPRGRELVNAHARTNFPLVGKHRYVECNACHVDGVIEGTPVSCESCHWTRTQDDPYRLQLGTQCESCHTPQAWPKLVAFSWTHEMVSGFRLEGAHRTVDCMSCHRDGRFGGVETRCASCHERDYLEAQEPDHVAAGFPRTCESCHLPSHRRWSQAVFFHRFPIDSGPHRLPCSDCHLTESYREFSCTHCHAHTPENAARFHAGVVGFIYASPACLACHPTGRWP